MPKDDRYTDALGVELGSRWTAIEAVGLYVPGGTAAYPSSVLMNAVPAKVAGVPRLVMVVPAPDGKLSPLVLAAAKLAGIDEIYRVGGAQAVAALAYGTETIAPVAKIVGPGNAYVAAAKRLVFGKVGIDMIAGPSEVLILADRTGNPDWIAADLLAQAEHDASAQSILITDDADLARRGREAVDAQLKSLPRAAVAGASWRDFGAVIVVGGLDEAVPLVDAIAPEHLEIESANAEELAARIRNAGAIFLGPHTPEAIGDYVGGSNHVLPTARSARFSSGLGVLDFMKRTSILKCGPEQLRALAPGRDRAGRSRGAGGPCPLGRDPPQSMIEPGAHMGTGDDPLGAHIEPAIHRLVAVTLDENSIGRSKPDVEHERAVAIYDLLEENTFAPQGRRRRAVRAASEHHRQRGWCSTSARGRRAGDGASAVAVAVAADREGLLHGLRQLLRSDPHRDARPHRGARHGPARAPRRGLQHPDGAAAAQGEARFRYRAAPVHADLRAALEGMKRDAASQRPQAVLFACGLNSVRSPMAGRCCGRCSALALCRLGRRAQRRARSVRGRGHGRDRHRHHRRTGR